MKYLLIVVFIFIALLTGCSNSGSSSTATVKVETAQDAVNLIDSNLDKLEKLTPQEEQAVLSYANSNGTNAHELEVRKIVNFLLVSYQLILNAVDTNDTKLKDSTLKIYHEDHVKLEKLLEDDNS